MARKKKLLAVNRKDTADCPLTDSIVVVKQRPISNACNGPGASWTWGARATTPGVTLGRSASASLRVTPATDLNVDAIKEKLLDNRIPESCV
ncbi:unnamed protein product [Colias eurytheme]|nr:unnamed protein product [Colias eurytheme]